MTKMFRTAFCKCSVAIVDIVIIVFMKIITNINIIPSIIIQISNRNTQSITQAALINACLCRYICKFSGCIQIISIHPAARIGIKFSPVDGVNNIFIGMMRLIQYKTIQVAIVVIIKKNGLR